MAAFDSPSAAGLPLALRNRFQRAAQRLRGVSGIQQRQGDRPAEERADVKVLNLHLHRICVNPSGMVKPSESVSSSWEEPK